jgi:putative spermidine/putrescine transport system permease protein
VSDITAAIPPVVAAARVPGRRFNPLWLALPGVLFLLAFLVFPSLQLLSLSIRDAETGEFTLAAFERAFGVGVYTRVLSTTFTVALQTTVMCLLLGYPLAYWLVRLPKQRQRMVILLVLLPFWTSALVKNFAWLVLLGRTGIVASFARWVGIAEPPDLLFNRGTVIFAMTHTMLPLAVVTMLPVMSQIEARLPLAAQTLGANGVQAFWRVFFQLSMPGVAAAGLLVFIGSLGFFITPALLGGPRETMLGQVIITQIHQLQNWTFAGALATMLIGSALATCLIYDQLFGLSSVSGGAPAQSGRSWSQRLGMRLLTIIAAIFSALSEGLARIFGRRRFEWVLPAYGWTIIAILLVPIFAFIPMGFTSSSFLSFPPPGFSLRWFAEYLNSPVWITATVRSFAIGIATGCVTLAIAALAAFAIARSNSRAAGAAFLLFMTPMIVPSIVIAVGLFYLFAQLSLVATDLGIVIGHTVTSIPIAFVILLATLKNYDWRLEQAAATLGANRWRTFDRVTIPLVKGGLAAAFIFAFLHSFEELTVAIFIGGGLKTTLPKQMWDDILLQVNPTLAAASVVVLVVVTSLFLVAEYLRPKT